MLPADLRRELGFSPGDELVVTREAAGVLRLQTRRDAARALIGSAGPALPGRSALADLRQVRAEQRHAEDEAADRP